LIRLLLITALLLFAGAAAAADSAQLIRPTDLRKSPYADAETVAALEAGGTLSVKERKGGWYRVDLEDGRGGWVPMTSVRLGGASTGGASGLGAALRFITTGRSGKTGGTPATGIRGLDSADVVHAQPDPEAVKHLQDYAEKPDGARRFAQAAELRSRTIAYPAPPKPEAPPEAASTQADQGILGFDGGD
jgi:hypothetical protein